MEELQAPSSDWRAWVGFGPVDRWRDRPEDNEISRFIEEIHDVGGIIVANHSFCPFKGCDWQFSYDYVDAIEVWNGPWT